MNKVTDHDVIEIFTDYLGYFLDNCTVHHFGDTSIIKGEDGGDWFYGVVAMPKPYEEMDADTINLRTTEINEEIFNILEKSLDK